MAVAFSTMLRMLGMVRDGFDEVFPSPVRMAWEEARAAGWQPDRPDAYCHRCGANAASAAVTAEGCGFCRGQSLPWEGIVRLSAYVPPMAEWIRRMKFRRQWRWSGRLAHLLAEAMRASPASARPHDSSAARWVVCPVPMHWTRRLRRGYNQADLLAVATARRLCLPHADLLRRTRWTRPQSRIRRSHRHDNVRGSFAARRMDLRGWSVWIVDDVKTSGATLATCAGLLRRQGAAAVWIAVLAVGDPRGMDFTRI